MERTEAYFIPHCDEPSCDLGTFEYTCPNCGKDSVDYDVWWNKEDISKGVKEFFECGKCGVSLVVEHNQREYEYLVSLKYDPISRHSA